MKFATFMGLVLGSLLLSSPSYAVDCKVTFTIKNTTGAYFGGVVIRRLPGTCFMSGQGDLPPGSPTVPSSFSEPFSGWFGCSCLGEYAVNVNSINQGERVWHQKITQNGQVTITFTNLGIIWQFVPS